MTLSAATIRRQIAIVRRELDALDRMVSETGGSATPVLNGATEITAVDLLAAKIVEFRQACVDSGVPVMPGELVYETAAASLLGKKPKTLRNWRQSDGRLPWQAFAGRTAY